MSATVAQAPPIHFRPETGESGASIGTALLIALLLLAAATAALVWAKRKGWLQAWTTGVSGENASAPRVLAKLRLSPRTVLYEIQTEQGPMHVVESSAHIAIRRASP
jgi:LPXTG-motif cell wall-anchored protein